LLAGCLLACLLAAACWLAPAGWLAAACWLAGWLAGWVLLACLLAGCLQAGRFFYRPTLFQKLHEASIIEMTERMI